MASDGAGILDVDWLLHSKKDHAHHPADKNTQKQDTQTSAPPPNPSEPTSTPRETTTTTQTPVVNGKSENTPQNGTNSQSRSQRPSLVRGHSTEDKRNQKNNVPAGKKDGRRSSWIASFSSKFSSPTPSRTSNVEAHAQLNHAAPAPQASPRIEISNPFNKKEATANNQHDVKKDDTKPTPPATPTPPRRPSVLVAAGKETKLDHPGFLSSALRRLSSSSNTTLGKGAAATGAICPRRIMNIDPNRERIKITEFDQNKLKRVAFCVDVEIAGFASQADEEPDRYTRPAGTSGQKQKPATTEKQAKQKDKDEGAALKGIEPPTDGQAVSEQPPPAETTSADKASSDDPAPVADPVPVPTTRKKEKKKRSEAERKERKEKKRRHAEANGLIPLELTREDDDSDSSPSTTPPGSSTPRKSANGPTTDPLRIYKRCCQLRETSVLNRMKEQITKPSATLSEAPGTVAVMDLSGLQMQLQDIVTLGDWLAIVPVRKLILDNCGLTDEGVRVILSGLASCKSPDQARHNRKLPKKLSGQNIERMGVIEKLSLKDNPAITNVGWRHIGLFLHMSRSLKAIDLSGIKFPAAGDATHNQTDLASLLIRALSERLGDRLEELVLSGCGLSTDHVRDLVDCAIKRKIRRLGLADNDLDQAAVTHVVQYIRSGACEGLDLGGNDLHGIMHILAEAADEQCPLLAISLSDCNLTPADLSAALSPFTKLTNLKFIDLSRNRALFSDDPNAVPIFRRLLPKMVPLRRIHLTDVGLTPDHVIALAEILPDCPSMAHISILDNEPLIHVMNSKEEGAQEEACAFFASLMTAVRVSGTIIAVEIEVPSADSSEVVKALASQVVAYSLRNMERTTLDEVGVKPSVAEKDAPEVLLHIVGHMEGYQVNHDKDDPAPDEDYVIASTGIVKCLDVILGSKDGNSQVQSRNISPARSGTVTPRPDMRQRSVSKPRDVSLELCESARKIRARLRPALIKEDRAGNDANYRRLFFLDQTLQRMIQRFEDEYPEAKHLASSPPGPNGLPSPDPSIDVSLLSASVDSNGLMRMASGEEEYFPNDADGRKDELEVNLPRRPSTTSLVSKAFTEEEGRMHRFGQSVRRELLKPTGTDDILHGTTVDDPAESAHLAALRLKLEELKGEDIRCKVERDGPDNVIRQLGVSAQELLMLRANDPEGFETFKESQLAAQINAGLIDVEGHDEHAIQ
ncbi:hypothetical protein ABEF95_004453 [Exophiala dermatitidis]